jgi:general secretion pathway protein I
MNATRNSRPRFGPFSQPLPEGRGRREAPGEGPQRGAPIFGAGHQNSAPGRSQNAGLHQASSCYSRPPKGRTKAGFTLIEVMVALAVVAIALLGLLGLQHQTLQSVVRASQMTTAALLAQELMTQTETGQFPALGVTTGNFESLHPRRYPNFRWERRVEPSAVFPDIRKVRVLIHYGPRLGRAFELTEMIRNPLALPGQGT